MTPKATPKERETSATPLTKKLGILTADSTPPKTKPREIVLIGAPEGFREGLGEFPAHVRFRARVGVETSLALCFVRSVKELEAVVNLLVGSLPVGASAWVIRPKTHLKPGFNENDVRDALLPHGLVDYKICSVSEEWTGLKFAWRKPGH